MARIPVCGVNRGVKFGLTGRMGANDVLPRTPGYSLKTIPESYQRGVATSYVLGCGYWKGRWYLGAWYNNYSYVFYTTDPWLGTWTSVLGTATAASGESYLRRFVGNDNCLVVYRTAANAPAETKIGASTDGTTFVWNVGVTLYGLCCNDTIFVGGGNGYLHYSTDGITWTSVAATGMWRAVCWSTTYQKFFAISTTGLIRTSTDGMTWSDATQGPVNAVFWDVIERDGRLLAVGTNCFMKSENGVDWTALTQFAGTNTMVSQIIYVPGQKKWYATTIAASTSDSLYMSDDGISWTSVPCYAYGKYGCTTNGDDALFVMHPGGTGYKYHYIAKSQKIDQGDVPVAGLGALGPHAFNARRPGLALIGDFQLGENGTGDFTISIDTGGMFTSGGGAFLTGHSSAVNNTYWQLLFADNSGYSTGTCIFMFQVYNAGTRILGFNSALGRSYWTGPKKLRIERSGTTFRWYVNGILETTATSSVVIPACDRLYSWLPYTLSNNLTGMPYFWNNLVIANAVRTPKAGIDIL